MGTDGDAARVRDALLALRGTDGVELLDGFTDAEMDGWPVPVPEAVRTVLRAVGGVRADDEEHEFGPRRLRPSSFAGGHWEVGSHLATEHTVCVAVGDPDAADWGPVVAVRPFDDPEAVVEAARFADWLRALAVRLTDPDADGLLRRASAAVDAVPSVAAAEGPDAALAALVGRGDQLADVADLRDLPALPCRIDFEPYYTYAHNTADTGSSELRFEMLGGGRALLVRSVISGDFLGRPVRRHAVPADAGRRAVAELQALAAEHPASVVLEPGCTDAEMDGWPVPVPPEVRTVLRAIGGVAVAGLPVLRLRPGGPGHEVDPEVHRMLGGDGSYWPIARAAYGRQHAIAQVRIDPGTGEWGYAVSVTGDAGLLREYPELTLLGESLADLLLTVARIARRAAGARDFARAAAAAAPWFFPNTGEAWILPEPVGEWSGAEDALRAAAAALPEGSFAGDLRTAPAPGDLCFYRADDWPYRARLDRLVFLGAGRIAAAVPEPA
ncbi:hypothetical protein [Streptomyces sp. NRRL B-24484]|uniref:hypothetical protein n=1 Tax=Streptomyces sp. NRRL B-24484 TaxID=1463833 RepID=UPI0004C28CA4|nr:hypothetical protein [Streptomyces sp. NRRL B-24484]